MSEPKKHAPKTPATPSPPPAKVPSAPPEKMEKDKGYGESHGYAPGHGGPSGPGDAPAREPATVVPLSDTDD